MVQQQLDTGIPHWVTDTAMRRRVIGVWRDHDHGLSVDELSAKYRVDASTIYADLDRARAEYARRSKRSIDEAHADRIESEHETQRRLHDRIDGILLSHLPKFKQEKLIIEYEKLIAKSNERINDLMGLTSPKGSTFNPIGLFTPPQVETVRNGGMTLAAVVIRMSGRGARVRPAPEYSQVEKIVDPYEDPDFDDVFEDTTAIETTAVTLSDEPLDGPGAAQVG